MSNSKSYILGVETSCDETAVAIYSDSGLIANEIYSQVAIHQPYGGVVPELASRDHVQKLLPLIEQTLTKAKITPQDLTAIAYTRGPGLIGALLVGAMTAKSLAFALNVPAIGVHHLEAHLMAAMLDIKQPDYPFITLLVSGGHTLLAYVQAFGHYQILGETLDDAAGEAFDKTAKLLGLPYPGGPELAKLAEQGNPAAFAFPRPMTDRPGLEFSFSGLKTAVRNVIAQGGLATDIAASFQAAVVETLLIKCERALSKTNCPRLVVAGGVSANKMLRSQLNELAMRKKLQVFLPRIEFCTDNAAMVAYTGWLYAKQGRFDADWSVNVKTRWEIGT